MCIRDSDKSAYIPFLKHVYEGQEAQARIDNIYELLGAVQYAESQEPLTIAQLLEDIALMQEKSSGPDQDNPVLLMTLHAAKGLEFDIVILAGLEEGLLPSARSLMHDELVEEERRLLYVGITRAKERVVLTYAKNRHTYGQLLSLIHISEPTRPY